MVVVFSKILTLLYAILRSLGSDRMSGFWVREKCIALAGSLDGLM